MEEDTEQVEESLTNKGERDAFVGGLAIGCCVPTVIIVAGVIAYALIQLAFS